jgi:hypothetical protein
MVYVLSFYSERVIFLILLWRILGSHLVDDHLQHSDRCNHYILFYKRRNWIAFTVFWQLDLTDFGSVSYKKTMVSVQFRSIFVGMSDEADVMNEI